MSDNLLTVHCPFCGQQQMIEYEEGMLPEMTEALAAMACNCAGSWTIKQQHKIKSLLGEDMEEGAVEAVLEMVKMMRSGFFDKISIKKEKYTYTISVNSENVLKFRRQESKKQEMTL